VAVAPRKGSGMTELTTTIGAYDEKRTGARHLHQRRDPPHARSTRCWTRAGPTTRPRPGRVSSRSPLASPTRSRWA
jgi:hypothetical protein